MNLIYPKPLKIVEDNGNFVFGDQLFLTVSKNIPMENLKNAQKLFSNFTANNSRLIANIVENESNVAVLNLNSSDITEKIDLLDLKYIINVEKEKITFAYTDKDEFSHAFATILQIIEFVTEKEFQIPLCKIEDKPQMKFRGIHVCVFPETKLNFLEKIIRLAGFLKYTHIVIEFWGTLKYDCASFLSWKEAFSKDEIRPLISLARAFGMQPIPMFNHLGHATASRSILGRHVVLDQAPEKELLFEPDGWTWCISNPETKALLKNIREELCELFGEGEYFHIGCDEAYSFATCNKCKSTDKIKLLENYLNNLADEFDILHRRPLIWGDALLDCNEWEAPLFATSRADQQTHKILENLSKKFIINDWQYDITTTPVKSISHFKNKGFEVISCPWYVRKNMVTMANSAIDENILGYLQTTWHTLHKNICEIPFGAELTWSGKNARYNESMMTVYTARLIRKIMPANGNYLNAGWREFEED